VLTANPETAAVYRFSSVCVCVRVRVRVRGYRCGNGDIRNNI